MANEMWTYGSVSDAINGAGNAQETTWWNIQLLHWRRCKVDRSYSARFRTKSVVRVQRPKLRWPFFWACFTPKKNVSRCGAVHILTTFVGRFRVRRDVLVSYKRRCHVWMRLFVCGFHNHQISIIFHPGMIPKDWIVVFEVAQPPTSWNPLG